MGTSHHSLLAQEASKLSFGCPLTTQAQGSAVTQESLHSAPSKLFHITLLENPNIPFGSCPPLHSDTLLPKDSALSIPAFTHLKL